MSEWGEWEQKAEHDTNSGRQKSKRAESINKFKPFTPYPLSTPLCIQRYPSVTTLSSFSHTNTTRNAYCFLRSARRRGGGDCNKEAGKKSERERGRERERERVVLR